MARITRSLRYDGPRRSPQAGADLLYSMPFQLAEGDSLQLRSDASVSGVGGSVRGPGGRALYPEYENLPVVCPLDGPDATSIQEAEHFLGVVGGVKPAIQGFGGQGACLGRR